MRTAWPALLLLGAACAANRGPTISSPLHRYDIVIRGRDSLSLALLDAFSRAGFTVRYDVRGGGRSAAALVWWRFVDPEGRGNLEAQLADTRRGIVVAVAMIPADTLAGDSARADLLVRALLTPSP